MCVKAVMLSNVRLLLLLLFRPSHIPFVRSLVRRSFVCSLARLLLCRFLSSPHLNLYNNNNKIRVRMPLCVCVSFSPSVVVVLVCTVYVCVRFCLILAFVLFESPICYLKWMRLYTMYTCTVYRFSRRIHSYQNLNSSKWTCCRWLCHIYIHKEESTLCSLFLPLSRSLFLSLDLRAAYYIVRVQIREGLAENENTNRSRVEKTSRQAGRQAARTCKLYIHIF